MGQCSVPGHVLNSFPTERLADNHRLIVNVSEKCGICLCSYRSSQVVRRLPCNHEVCTMEFILFFIFIDLFKTLVKLDNSIELMIEN